MGKRRNERRQPDDTRAVDDGRPSSTHSQGMANRTKQIKKVTKKTPQIKRVTKETNQKKEDAITKQKIYSQDYCSQLYPPRKPRKEMSIEEAKERSDSSRVTRRLGIAAGIMEKKLSASKAKTKNKNLLQKLSNFKVLSTSEAEAILDEHVRGHRGGGLMIPGPRTGVDVFKYLALGTSSYQTDLLQIIQMNKTVKDENLSIERQREKSKTVNRRVIYPDSRSTDHHSLHFGTDIAAVYNGSRGNRVYGYKDLSRKLDMRLRYTDPRPVKAPAGGVKAVKSYYNQPSIGNAHLKYIENALIYYSKGMFALGDASLTSAGLNDKGKKWVRKLATIQMAERARAFNAGGGHQGIDDAVRLISTHGFTGVFGEGGRAPYAGVGGAQWFRDQAARERQEREPRARSPRPGNAMEEEKKPSPSLTPSPTSTSFGKPRDQSRKAPASPSFGGTLFNDGMNPHLPSRQRSRSPSPQW